MVIVDDEEDANKNEQIASSLQGRLHINNSFGIRAMTPLMHNIWKPTKGIIMYDLDTNMFGF